MSRDRRTLAVTLFLVSTTLASGCRHYAAGQGDPGDPPPIELHEGTLGHYHWTVSTSSPRAQDYFNQGARLMFAYAPGEARRSFAEARRLDPGCAMCWWGEAWALGPYLNGGMSRAAMPVAYDLIQRARMVSAEGTSPVERALIEAMDLRYPMVTPTGSRAPLDSVYADAMAEVYARFPDNDEVATLYADALMLLEPRRGIWPIEKPSVQRIHAVLEGVLARHIGHPGACHAYVHATETTPRVTNAEACADLLGSSIPGASHINHMPSHTYNRVGRWGDATAANIVAWHTDLRAEQGEGYAIYPGHNLHMLFFSAAMDGQGAISMQAAKDYGRYDPEGGAGFQALTRVRFGRFAEVLELPTNQRSPIFAGMVAFGRGLAHLRLEHPDSAAWYLARVDSLAAHAPEGYSFRVHTAAQLLGVLEGILRGELLRSEGRVEEAVSALEAAVEVEAGLTYDEPEPLPLSARDYLGAMLVEAGRPAEATRVYEAALVARPHNGWSLRGLERSLRAEGRVEEADGVRERFERAWVRSEVLLQDSRY